MTLEDEMLKALSDGGIAVGPDGRFINSGTGLATDEQVRLLNLQAERRQHDTNARLKANWVRNLEEVVKTLANDGEAAPWPFMALFWVRLQPVLGDLRAEHVARFRRDAIDPMTHQAQPASALNGAIGIFRAIESIRSEFTEDELIYIDYRRHTEAHPTQDAFDFRWSHKAKAVADRHGVTTVGRELRVAELDAAIRRVLHAHPNESAIAVSFARRIVARLPRLVFLTRVGAGG